MNKHIKSGIKGMPIHDVVTVEHEQILCKEAFWVKATLINHAKSMQI